MPSTKEDVRKVSDREARYDLAISRLNDLPTIPNTLLRIWKLVDSPNCSAADLEKVITMDQALSSKILRLSNSPYYGVRCEVTSCRMAITLLGFNTVRNMSICVSVASAFLPAKDKGCLLDLVSLWRHSVSCGIVAKLLAKKAGYDDSDAAFSAGILHDIGKFVMNLCLTGEYGAVLKEVREKGMSIREAEKAVFSADHSYFGARFAKMWGFPKILIRAIENHHEDRGEDEQIDLEEVVSLANKITKSLKLGFSGDPVEEEVEVDKLSRFGIDGEGVERFYDKVKEQVISAQEFMTLL